MEECCQIGNIPNEERILYKTDNFFIAPTIGPISIRDYLLLCSKKHFDGIGGMPEEHHLELEDTLEKTKRILSETYNSKVLAFEHGPKVGCYKGGGCLDHAHLHILPLTNNVMNPLAINFLKALQVDDYYNIKRIDDLNRLTQLYHKQEASYFFIESNEQKRYLTKVNFPLPSQYIRQIIASNLKRSNWDWRIHPDHKTMNKTLIDLENKFN